MRAERAGIGNLACLVVALKMGPRKRVTQFLMNSRVLNEPCRHFGAPDRCKPLRDSHRTPKLILLLPRRITRTPFQGSV